MLIREYFLPQLEASRKAGQSNPILYFILDRSTQAGFARDEGVRMEVHKIAESELVQLSTLTFERMTGNLPVFLDNKMVEHELL